MSLPFVSRPFLRRTSCNKWHRVVLARSGDNDPGIVFGKLKDKGYLDVAAKKFAFGETRRHAHGTEWHDRCDYAGIENGIDEDEMVAMELGAKLDELSDLQRTYLGKVKEKLQKRADEMKAEQAELEAKIAKSYTLGKEAYE